jgi:hypothetical protein
MIPVTAALAVLMVHQSGQPCTPATLRQWVRRGHIRRTPKGYDLASIADYLEHRAVNRV